MGFRVPCDFPDANLQFINGYEKEDGTIILDVIRSEARQSGGESASTLWPWVSTLVNFRSLSSKKSLWRYSVHPLRGFVSKECISKDQLYFGVVNPTKAPKSIVISMPQLVPWAKMWH